MISCTVNVMCPESGRTLISTGPTRSVVFRGRAASLLTEPEVLRYGLAAILRVIPQNVRLSVIFAIAWHTFLVPLVIQPLAIAYLVVFGILY